MNPSKNLPQNGLSTSCGALIAIVGPSGVGKSTLEARIRRTQQGLGVTWLSVAKTRQSRCDEIFHNQCCKAYLNQLRREGSLLTYFRYFDGQIYAMESQPCLTLLACKQDVVVGLDVPAAVQLIQKVPSIQLVALSAPEQVIITRLRMRNRRITSTEVARRLEAWRGARVAMDNFSDDTVHWIDATARTEDVFFEFTSILRNIKKSCNE